MTLKDKILYAFFPARCTVCDRVLYPGEDLCEGCEKLVLHYPVIKAACNICGLEHADCPCGRRLLYAQSVVPFFYEKDVQRALHRMKFRGRLDLVKPFARRMSVALEERKMLEGVEVISFIPMRRKARFARGYNQSELLAKEVGNVTGLPVQPLLYKTGDSPKQHSLGYSRRRGNIIGSFEPLPDRLRDIEGKNILLIDDIITTGSTLNEAAKTLLIFGAENVKTAAAAQVRKKEDKSSP